MARRICIYLLGNARRDMFYVGRIEKGELENRVCEHKIGLVDPVTRAHKIDRLLWYEYFRDKDEADQAELLLRSSSRKWKEELMRRTNQEWVDRYEELV